VILLFLPDQLDQLVLRDTLDHKVWMEVHQTLALKVILEQQGTLVQLVNKDFKDILEQQELPDTLDLKVWLVVQPIRVQQAPLVHLVIPDTRDLKEIQQLLLDLLVHAVTRETRLKL
jgi:hypothetical protein